MKQMKRRIAIYLALMLGVSGAAPSFVPGFGYEVVKASEQDPQTQDYTVKFYEDKEKATLVSSQTVLSTDTDRTVKTPEGWSDQKEGHTFLGWMLEQEDGSIGNEAWNFDSPVTASMNLIATWSVNQYTVTFISENDAAPFATVPAAWDTTITAPDPAPAKDGFDFDKWLKADGSEWVFATDKVKEDTTLTASWNAMPETPPVTKYTVTFKVNNKIISTCEVVSGDTVGKLQPDAKDIPEGFTFEDWKLESAQDETPWDFTQKVEDNITLVAILKALPKYTVSFNNGESNDESLKVEVFENGTITKPSKIPEKPSSVSADQIFRGWTATKGSKNEWDFTSKVTTGFTLYAIWDDPATYTVTFNTDGGSTVSNSTVKEVQDGTQKATKPADPTKAGYTFLGWFTSANVEWNFDNAVTGNITLTAKWQKVAGENEVTVSFDSVGGTFVDPQVISKNSKVTKPADPTKADNTFAGWYNGSVSWNFDNTVSTNMTLTAHWTPNAVDPDPSKPTYTVTFTGEGVTTTSQNVVSGNKVTKPADPTRDGFTFVGWYNGDVAWDFNTPVTGNLTLTAKWTDVVSCNHTWDKGTVTVSADCMNTGIMTYTCTKCGATKPEIIEVNGEHKWDAGKVTQSANCVTEGKMAYTCTVCGSTKEEVISINASQHRWDDGVVTTSANCTQKGVKTFTCLDCKKATKTEEIEALGHKWNEGTVTKEPTCTEEGKKTVSCQNCTETKEEAIPATGHKWDEGKVTKAATCTEDGVKEFTCQSCKETKTEAIKAAGHKYGAYKVTRAATVLKAGEKVRTCSVCGATQKATIAKLAPTIKLSATNVTLRVGKATTIKVTGLAKGDAVKSWKSSNTKVAKVSAKGKITAQKKTGKATVTVTLKSGKKATVKVTVQKKEVKTTKITGVAKKATLKVGKKLTLKPVLKPATSTQKITYTTSNKKVATVNAKGVITAKKAGKAKITVKSGSKKVVMTVTVKKK